MLVSQPYRVTQSFRGAAELPRVCGGKTRFVQPCSTKTATCWGLLGLLAVIGVSAPAAAGDVTACGNFLTATDTRFDLKDNITFAGGGICLQFPANAIVYLNGFIVGGPGYDASPEAIGITLGNNSFLWGPGIVKQFTNCVVGRTTWRSNRPPEPVWHWARPWG